jgi:hypothetical protein
MQRGGNAGQRPCCGRFPAGAGYGCRYCRARPRRLHIGVRAAWWRRPPPSCPDRPTLALTGGHGRAVRVGPDHSSPSGPRPPRRPKGGPHLIVRPQWTICVLVCSAAADTIGLSRTQLEVRVCAFPRTLTQSDRLSARSRTPGRLDGSVATRCGPVPIPQFERRAGPGRVRSGQVSEEIHGWVDDGRIEQLGPYAACRRAIHSSRWVSGLRTGIPSSTGGSQRVAGSPSPAVDRPASGHSIGWRATWGTVRPETSQPASVAASGSPRAMTARCITGTGDSALRFRANPAVRPR